MPSSIGPSQSIVVRVRQASLIPLRKRRPSPISCGVDAVYLSIGKVESMQESLIGCSQPARHRAYHHRFVPPFHEPGTRSAFRDRPEATNADSRLILATDRLGHRFKANLYGSGLGIGEPDADPAHQKEQQPTTPTEGRFRLPLSCLTATYGETAASRASRKKSVLSA